HWSVRFDGLELVAVLEHRVRDRPALNVGGPCHQSGSIPETDRFSVPLWNLLDMLFSNQYLTQEVGSDSREELNIVDVHRQLKVAALRCLRPPAHETLGVTEGSVPLRRIVDTLVIIHLNHALLIFRRQDRQDRRYLVDRAPCP